MSATSLWLTPLGGVGRFGRNCLLVELGDADGNGARGPALVVDCGVRFVHDDAPGYDVGLPDLERLGVVGDRLRAYVITHGHEDHIGGLPYAWRERPAPMFATPFTAQLIERRFARVGEMLPEGALTVVPVGGVVELAPFSVRFVAVSHSIPDATALAITTPAGVIVHSGDFRVDDDPVLGPPTDLDSLCAIGDAGVLCLLADSTGALVPGRNPGEKSVRADLERAVVDAHGVCAVTLFASHIQRLALLAEVCRAHHKRLLLVGRGLVECARTAEALGLFTFSDIAIDEATSHDLPRDRQVWAVTGSQGERDSALGRLSRDEGAGTLSLKPHDRVVFSARVIPGNESVVLALVERLVERGIDVVDGYNAPHVSGHGYQEDLRLLLAAVRPRAFVALHGNARNLLAHQALVEAGGVDRARIVDLRDGHSLVVDAAGCEHRAGAPAKEPMAAWGRVDWWPGPTVRARRRMEQAGVLVVVEGGALLPRAAQLDPTSDAELLAELERTAAEAFTLDDDAAVQALARVFRRARRPAPEIVLVRR